MKKQTVQHKNKTSGEMFDIIDSIPELDNCNIIALHKVLNKAGAVKLCIIADDMNKKIIKVDIFANNNDFSWDITYPIN